MIKHIVMWHLLDHAAGHSKTTNAQKIKELIEALNGVIPGLITVEIGFDFSKSDASADVVLYSELESREALADYQQHPEHQAAVNFIKTVISARKVVDYEC